MSKHRAFSVESLLKENNIQTITDDDDDDDDDDDEGKLMLLITVIIIFCFLSKLNSIR